MFRNLSEAVTRINADVRNSGEKASITNTRVADLLSKLAETVFVQLDGVSSVLAVQHEQNSVPGVSQITLEDELSLLVEVEDEAIVIGLTQPEIHLVVAAPSDADGVDGDLAFNRATGQWYEKAAGVWSPTHQWQVYTVPEDRTRPLVSLSGPPSPVGQTFQIFLDTNEDVTGVEASDFQIAGATAGTPVMEINNRRWRIPLTLVTPTPTTVSVLYPSDKCEDLAGNKNLASNQLTFTVGDLSRPSVVVSGPSRVSAAFTFNVLFSEAVTGFAVDDIQVTGVSSGSLSLAGSGANYTVTVDPIPGDNVSMTFRVRDAAAQDGSSNASLPSNVYQTRVDTSAPVISFSTPTIVSGQIRLNMIASEPLQEFDADVFELLSDGVTDANASLTVGTPTGTTWPLIWTTTSGGMLTLKLPEESVFDQTDIGNADDVSVSLQSPFGPLTIAWDPPVEGPLDAAGERRWVTVKLTPSAKIPFYQNTPIVITIVEPSPPTWSVNTNELNSQGIVWTRVGGSSSPGISGTLTFMVAVGTTKVRFTVHDFTDEFGRKATLQERTHEITFANNSFTVTTNIVDRLPNTWTTNAALTPTTRMVYGPVTVSAAFSRAINVPAIPQSKLTMLGLMSPWIVTTDDPLLNPLSASQGYRTQTDTLELYRTVNDFVISQLIVFGNSYSAGAGVNTISNLSVYQRAKPPTFQVVPWCWTETQEVSENSRTVQFIIHADQTDPDILSFASRLVATGHYMTHRTATNPALVEGVGNPGIYYEQNGPIRTKRLTVTLTALPATAASPRRYLATVTTLWNKPGVHVGAEPVFPETPYDLVTLKQVTLTIPGGVFTADNTGVVNSEASGSVKVVSRAAGQAYHIPLSIESRIKSVYWSSVGIVNNTYLTAMQAAQPPNYKFELRVEFPLCFPAQVATNLLPPPEGLPAGWVVSANPSGHVDYWNARRSLDSQGMVSNEYRSPYVLSLTLAYNGPTNGTVIDTELLPRALNLNAFKFLPGEVDQGYNAVLAANQAPMPWGGYEIPLPRIYGDEPDLVLNAVSPLYVSEYAQPESISYEWYDRREGIVKFYIKAAVGHPTRFDQLLHYSQLTVVGANLHKVPAQSPAVSSDDTAFYIYPSWEDRNRSQNLPNIGFYWFCYRKLDATTLQQVNMMARPVFEAFWGPVDNSRWVHKLSRPGYFTVQPAQNQFQDNPALITVPVTQYGPQSISVQRPTTSATARMQPNIYAKAWVYFSDAAADRSMSSNKLAVEYAEGVAGVPRATKSLYGAALVGYSQNSTTGIYGLQQLVYAQATVGTPIVLSGSFLEPRASQSLLEIYSEQAPYSISVSGQAVVDIQLMDASSLKHLAISGLCMFTPLQSRLANMVLDTLTLSGHVTSDPSRANGLVTSNSMTLGSGGTLKFGVRNIDVLTARYRNIHVCGSYQMWRLLFDPVAEVINISDSGVSSVASITDNFPGGTGSLRLQPTPAPGYQPLREFYARNCNLTGVVNLTVPMSMDVVDLSYNPGLTGIRLTHVPISVPQRAASTVFKFNNCDLTLAQFYAILQEISNAIALTSLTVGPTNSPWINGVVEGFGNRFTAQDVALSMTLGGGVRPATATDTYKFWNYGWRIKAPGMDGDFVATYSGSTPTSVRIQFACAGGVASPIAAKYRMVNGTPTLNYPPCRS